MMGIRVRVSGISLCNDEEASLEPEKKLPRIYVSIEK